MTAYPPKGGYKSGIKSVHCRKHCKRVKMNPKPANYTCIIVDDNELDRLTIVSYTRRYPFIQIAGVFESAASALTFTQKHELPDALLLDIDMPAMNGLD